MSEGFNNLSMDYECTVYQISTLSINFQQCLTYIVPNKKRTITRDPPLKMWIMSETELVDLSGILAEFAGRPDKSWKWCHLKSDRLYQLECYFMSISQLRWFSQMSFWSISQVFNKAQTFHIPIWPAVGRLYCQLLTTLIIYVNFQ